MAIFAAFLLLSLLNTANGVPLSSNKNSNDDSNSVNSYEWTHGDVRVRVTYGNNNNNRDQRRLDKNNNKHGWVWFCYGVSDDLCVTSFPYSKDGKRKALVVRKRVELARRTGRGRQVTQVRLCFI